MMSVFDIVNLEMPFSVVYKLKNKALIILKGFRNAQIIYSLSLLHG